MNVERPGNTLHEAIRIILESLPNQTGTTQRIAEAIAERNLYRKKDGDFAQDWQIFLRAKNYPQLFDVIDRDTIRLAK